MTVAVPVARLRMALTGLERATVKVSSGSARLSPTTGIRTVCTVSPGANVTEPIESR